jgi:hypothetical protein
MDEFTALVLGFIVGFLLREYFDRLIHKLRKRGVQNV